MNKEDYQLFDKINKLMIEVGMQANKNLSQQFPIKKLELEMDPNILRGMAIYFEVIKKVFAMTHKDMYATLLNLIEYLEGD